MDKGFIKTESKVNPEISSIREEVLELVPLGYEEHHPIMKEQGFVMSEIFVDKKSGEKFHKITKNPKLQKFVSLLVKSNINVSDVVEVNGDYFSHEQNVENLSTKENYLEEMTADTFILKEVLGDGEHRYYSEGHIKREGEEKNTGEVSNSTFKEHANLLVDEKNKKINYFDFNLAFNNFFWKTIIDKDHFRHFLSENRNSFFDENGINSFDEYPSKNRKKVLEILRNKSNSFLNDIFNHKEIFDSIVKKAGIKFDKETFPNFRFSGIDDEDNKKQVFSEVADRFFLLKEVTEEELSKLETIK